MSEHNQMLGRVTRQPSEEHPAYAAEETASGTCLVSVDEGWRRSVLCVGMPKWAADWLVGQLQGKPFAPNHRPDRQPQQP
jgi:hypothetical protein